MISSLDTQAGSDQQRQYFSFHFLLWVFVTASIIWLAAVVADNHDRASLSRVSTDLHRGF
jgi:hypothetical protein